MKTNLKRLRYGPGFQKAEHRPPWKALATLDDHLAAERKLPSWRRRSKLLRIGDESRESRTLPTWLPESVQMAFATAGEITAPAPSVLVLPGARTAGLYGAIISAENYLLSSVSFNWRHQHPAHEFLEVERLSPAKWRPGLVAVVAGQSGSYYHWLFELLPRLEMVRRAGYEFADFDQVIINRPKFAPQADTLDLVGLPAGKRMFSQRALHLGAKLMVVPTFPRNTRYGVPSWVHRYLREKFLPLVKPASGSRRIYLSRRKVGVRGLLNEEALLQGLAEKGFEMLFLEEMAFLDQVAAFAQAEMVIGMHGAGLANLVFCPPGTRVLEILSRARLRPHYWLISDVVGLRYHCLIGEVAGSEEDPPVRVDVEHFWRALDRLISG